MQEAPLGHFNRLMEHHTAYIQCSIVILHHCRPWLVHWCFGCVSQCIGLLSVTFFCCTLHVWERYINERFWQDWVLEVEIACRLRLVLWESGRFHFCLMRALFTIYYTCTYLCTVTKLKENKQWMWLTSLLTVCKHVFHTENASFHSDIPLNNNFLQVSRQYTHTVCQRT